MLERIKKHLINIPGKSLKQKYVVFESDDWGSIRIPNTNVLQQLEKKKLIDVTDPFSKIDTLESKEDLEALFSMLQKHKDSTGKPPIFTANMVMANPDFGKIKSDNFENYYHEHFSATYEKYESTNDTFELLVDGIKNELFQPQFHAREHLNVPIWMRLLQERNKDFLTAFDLECFAITYKTSQNRRANLMASYDYHTQDDLDFIKTSIVEGLQLFESTFSQSSKTTIAPCYVWESAIEETFKENNVTVFQGSRFQNVPIQESVKFKKVFHYNGQKSASGCLYLLRNGLFEPAVNPNIDWVSKSMESIDAAFSWNKPAIIGTHRINYVGSLDSNNRESNLKLLDTLLHKILRKWPDVEFISSADLAALYEKNR